MVLATLEPINASNDTHVHPSIEIEKPSVVLGRDPEKCDVVVTTSKSISMEHCQFDFRNDKWYITDLKSMNGTMVGEDRVTDGATMEIFDNNVLKFGRDTVSYRFKTREKKEKKSLKDVMAEGKKKVHDESVISFPTATGTKVVPVSPDGFIRPEASLQSISNFIPVEDEEDEEELEDDERQISPSFEEFRELSGRVVDLENVVSNTRKRGVSPDIKRTRREEKPKTPITPIEEQYPLSPSRDEFKLLRERVAYLESNTKNPPRASSPNPDQFKLLRERVAFLENAVNQAQQSPPSPIPKRDEPSQILIDSIYDLASKLHKQMGLEQPMDDSHEITPNDQLFITKNLLQQMLLSSRKKQPPPDMQQVHDMGVERYAHDLERQLVSAQVDVNQEPLPPLPPELDEILRDELEIKEEQIEQLTQQIMDMNTSRYSNAKNRMSSSLLHQLQEAENARRLVYEYERRHKEITLAWNALLDERDRFHERVQSLTSTIQGQMNDTQVLVLQREQQLSMWRTKFIELSAQGNDHRKRAAEFIISQLQSLQSQMNQYVLESQDIRQQSSLIRIENNELKLEINRLSDMLKLSGHEVSSLDRLKQLETECDPKRIATLQQSVSALQIRAIRAEKKAELVLGRLGNNQQNSDAQHLLQTQARCIAYLEKLLAKKENDIQRLTTVQAPAQVVQEDNQAVQRAEDMLHDLQNRAEIEENRT